VDQNRISHGTDDIPRFEPWLGVMAASLLPAGVALFLPHAFAIPLITCTVLLFAAGSVMLSIQSRRRAHARDDAEARRRPPNATTARAPAAAEAE
jgi:hypothetical protein